MPSGCTCARCWAPPCPTPFACATTQWPRCCTRTMNQPIRHRDCRVTSFLAMTASAAIHDSKMHGLPRYARSDGSRFMVRVRYRAGYGKLAMTGSMIATLLGVALLLGGCGGAPVIPAPAPIAVPTPVPAPAAKTKPVIGLVLGGGAAKGFAHIGVIKALEAQGIAPDLVIGTSAGALVGALYAAGKSGFELQALAIPFNEGQVSDWVLPDRGMIKGDALAKFINATVDNRPLEKLPRKFGVVATDLASGEPVVFRTGDTGTAVRASSSVPGLFQPVLIRGHEYVDGGLSSPVPVRFAHQMGATFVIAVDISDT